MGLDHLWAGWRSTYIESIVDGRTTAPGATEAATGDATEDATAVRYESTPPPAGEGSLFERILAMADDDAFIVHRGVTCAVLLNAYPYTSGHVLVLPNRAVADLSELSEAEHVELWSLVRDAVAAMRGAYRCEGVNVGVNLGGAAGAGVPDHLHVHVLPRWHGDTNFMTSVAQTRVMPEPLSTTWQKLTAAWPT
jgi:diadenosine tetraphosphate (Ap4A) HIT family hydrolase